MSDIAVLHGNYLARGGGERVADAIAEASNAPLYYGFGNDEALPNDDIDRIQLFDPNILSKKFTRMFYQYRDFRFMWDGTHIPELFDYDVIIQSGNEFGWYIPKQMDQTIVKYVHSPPRGPYDMHYKHGDSILHKAYSLLAKTLYRHTTSYIDAYISNSETVAKRCRKAWGVEPETVYPPVDVDNYGQEYAETQRERTYLTFSRLYRHKRTREIVQAFNGLESNLIVGGKGPQKEHLESIAPDNVEIAGYLPEETKQRLLAEVDGFIFNAENEDFGIVPIETFASGTPVIGINDGFTKYQIRDGENGVLYPTGNPASIKQAIRQFEKSGVSWDSDKLESFADQFSRDRFNQEMKAIVEKANNHREIEPKLNFNHD